MSLIRQARVRGKLRYEKRINGDIVYLEEYREGRNKLAFKTMWKVRAENNEGGRTPQPTAKTDAVPETGAESRTAPPTSNIFTNQPEVNDRSILFSKEPMVRQIKDGKAEVITDNQPKSRLVSLLEKLGGGQKETTSADYDSIMNLAISMKDRILNAGTDVVVFKTADEASAAIGQKVRPGAEGFYFNDKVYLVADSINNIERAQEVLAHELVGHHLLPRLLGPVNSTWHQEIMSLAETDPTVKGIFNEEVKPYYQNSSEHASELNARIAERFATDPRSVSEKVSRWINRKVADINTILRSLGIEREFDINDVSNMIQSARDFMIEPQGIAYSFEDIYPDAEESNPTNYSAATRKIFPSEYPDSLKSVTYNTHHAKMKNHPDYRAAKSQGDSQAAMRLVSDMINEKAIQDLRAKLDGRPRIFMPVLDFEGQQDNMIPMAYAAVLATRLNGQVLTDIFQKKRQIPGDVNKLHESSANERTKTETEFVGDTPSNKYQVILVDDVFTSGNTLTAIIDKMTEEGNMPVAATAISPARYQSWLAVPSPAKTKAFLKKAGLSKAEFVSQFGYPVDAITGSEMQAYILNGKSGIEGAKERFPVSDRGLAETQQRIAAEPDAQKRTIGQKFAEILYSLNGEHQPIDSSINTSDVQKRPLGKAQKSSDINAANYKQTPIEALLNQLHHSSETQPKPENTAGDQRSPVELLERLGATEDFQHTSKGTEDSIIRYSQKLRDIEFAEDTTAPVRLDVRGSNTEISAKAAEVFASWPEKIQAADGAIILLKNEESGRLSNRLKHLIWNNSTNRLNREKAEWLPNVPNTLSQAAARLFDGETGNKIYVMAYENGDKHMVVVSPEGIVENQTMLSGSLVTQFAYNKPGRQEKMEIEWIDGSKIVEGRRDSIGRSSGNPNPTPESANDPELSLPRHSSSRPSTNNNNINRENIKPKSKVDYAIAHHGTPHTFEPEPGFPHGRFSLDKIGSGEGAQSFGWGIYFAENADVSEGYRDRLRNTSRPGIISVDGVDYQWKDALDKFVDPTEATVLKKLGDKREFDLDNFLLEYVMPEIRETLNLDPDDYLVVNWPEDTSSHYQLDIPDSVIPQLLDLDKTLADQSPKVREGIEKFLADIKKNDAEDVFSDYLERKNIDSIYELTGREFQQQILSRAIEDDIVSPTEATYERGMEIPEAVSDYMREVLQIPGNQYLDGFSRKAGDGTRNYVIWDQGTLDQIVLLEHNAEPLDGIRYSIADDVQSWNSQLDSYFDGSLPSGKLIEIASTPDVLQMLGARSLPIAIKQSTLDKAQQKHGLTESTIRQIPQQIHNPLMVFESKTAPDSLVVMTELEHEGKPIVAAVHLSKTLGRHVVNDIASIYGKDSSKPIENWAKAGLLKYWDENRASEWFQSRGLQLPKEGTHRGSTKNILTSGDLVKWKKDRDSSSSTPEYSIKTEETSPDPFRIEEEPMPELTEIGKEEAKGFMEDVKNVVKGTLGDEMSISDRKLPEFLAAQKRMSEAETFWEIYREGNHKRNDRIKKMEDQLITQHLDADRNAILAAIRKYTSEGDLQDWLIKKAARVLAPWQALKPIEQTLFAIAEHMYWDGEKMAPIPGFRIQKEDGTFIYHVGPNHVMAAQKFYEALSPEWKQLLTERAKKNRRISTALS